MNVTISVTKDQLKLYDSVNAGLFTDPYCIEPYWSTHKHFIYDICILTIRDVVDILCEFYECEVTIEDAPDNFWDLQFTSGIWTIV